MNNKTTNKADYIPNFSYPFEINNPKEYTKILTKTGNGNYLFSKDGFFHGGIHFENIMFNDLKVKNNNIKCIADGEIVAYRINKDYYDEKDMGIYSSGFFLVRHKIEYPKDNIFIFFSLYMHTAKIDDYLLYKKDEERYVVKTEYYKITEILIRDKIDEVVVLDKPIEVKAGDIIARVGEYNGYNMVNNQCLHLEVFSNLKFKDYLSNIEKDDKTAQSFNWIDLIDEQSNDKVSIVTNLEALFNQEIESEFNQMYKKIFDLIDKNSNGKLEPSEISQAVKDEVVKETTKTFVVKHSSEWDKRVNIANIMLEIVNNQREKILNKEEYVKDLNILKQRIENLSFFDECRSIEGFPKDDMVYVFNPIGLVERFKITRKRRDYNLGTLSSIYETGGRGSITVSGGIDDPGGVSYGSYQLTSKPNGGNVKKFINDESFIWKNEFTNLTIGSQEFSQKWKELVRLHGNNFSKIEHEYIKKTHFDIQIQKIITETSVDIRYHSHTLNDVVWSTSVQHGSETNIITKIIQSLNILEEETKVYDEKLINEIYKERGRKDNTGRLVRFPRVKEMSTMNNLNNRFDSELLEALERLEDETNY